MTLEAMRSTRSARATSSVSAAAAPRSASCARWAPGLRRASMCAAFRRRARPRTSPAHSASRSSRSTTCRGIDLAVDGADEVDPEGRLIKGYGGRAAAREGRRGVRGPGRDPRRSREVRGASRHARSSAGRGVAVRAAPVLRRLEQLGVPGVPRLGRSPELSDNGNLLVDCQSAHCRTRPRSIARSTRSRVCSRLDSSWTGAPRSRSKGRTA